MNSGWQKPLALCQKLIKRYGHEQGGWILDSFCGSGTFTHAAVLMGMSSFAFDHNKYKVDATLHRGINFRDQYDTKQELETRPTREKIDDDDDDEEREEREEEVKEVEEEVMATAGAESDDKEDDDDTEHELDKNEDKTATAQRLQLAAAEVDATEEAMEAAAQAMEAAKKV